jgi:hypothetical protein
MKGKKWYWKGIAIYVFEHNADITWNILEKAFVPIFFHVHVCKKSHD